MRKLRFFSSLRTRFAITCFAVVTIVLLLMNTYFLMASRDNVFASKRMFAESQASLIATHLEEAFISFSDVSDERIEYVVLPLGGTDGTHIIITDDEGTVVYDPHGVSLRGNFHTHYIDIALEDNDIFYSEFTGGAFYTYAFRPVISQGVIIGVVCFNEIDASQGAFLLGMQGTIMNITIIVSVSSVFFIMLIILYVMRRVNSIINAVKSVREGEYSYIIKMGGNDEFAVLSDEFNSLTGRLRETDEIRRRFVADASHELKTPLATIRLLTDSILQNRDIETDTVLEFISDINMEAERLARTTDKLMTLTRLDSQVADELVKINLKEAIHETVRMLKSTAEMKKVSIRTQLSDECYIMATEESVHHIVFNLTENAIKYNQPGGSVFIKLDKQDGKIRLTVKDRGIGIPDEDLPHIFDRFFRVDKARARDATAAGSGLGLAIVRDTVRDLGGNVTASKRENGGMSFTVEFNAVE